MTPTHLSLGVTLLVLLAGVLHATWNAMTKAIKDQLMGFGLLGAGAAVASAVALPFTGLPDRAALGYAVASALIHVGYNLSLMRSYHLGDFGQTYPLARGTSPLLVALGALVFAHEGLSLPTLVGVATIAGALVALALAGGRGTRSSLPATLAAVLTGVTIASYTVVDGLGVRHAGHAFAYIALLFVLQGPVLAIAAGWRRRHDPAWRTPATVAAGLGAGLLSLIAYGIVIWAQTHGPLAVVSALRETSVISAAVIALVVFHERLGWRRIPPAVAVVAGILLINL